MTTTPLLELIAQNVLDTLTNITVANGFNYSLNVTRSNRYTSAVHLSCEIYQGENEPITDDVVTMTDVWRQRFHFVVYLKSGESDTTPTDRYNNLIYADIYQSMMTDYTRGGLSVNTMMHGYIPFPPYEGEDCGMTVICDVHYRHQIDNPYISAA